MREREREREVEREVQANSALFFSVNNKNL